MSLWRQPPCLQKSTRFMELLTAGQEPHFRHPELSRMGAVLGEVLLAWGRGLCWVWSCHLMTQGQWSVMLALHMSLLLRQAAQAGKGIFCVVYILKERKISQNDPNKQHPAHAWNSFFLCPTLSQNTSEAFSQARAVGIHLYHLCQSHHPFVILLTLIYL